MLQPKIEDLCPNDFPEWEAFESHEPADPSDDYGWFHVRIGANDSAATNDFQVCVATPRACGRAKAAGSRPGIIVDRFDATSVRDAVFQRVESIEARDWEALVEELRAFMLWEYEGMSGA